MTLRLWTSSLRQAQVHFPPVVPGAAAQPVGRAATQLVGGAAAQPVGGAGGLAAAAGGPRGQPALALATVGGQNIINWIQPNFVTDANGIHTCRCLTRSDTITLQGWYCAARCPIPPPCAAGGQRSSVQVAAAPEAPREWRVLTAEDLSEWQRTVDDSEEVWDGEEQGIIRALTLEELMVYQSTADDPEELMYLGFILVYIVWLSGLMKALLGPVGSILDKLALRVPFYHWLSTHLKLMAMALLRWTDKKIDARVMEFEGAVIWVHGTLRDHVPLMPWIFSLVHFGVQYFQGLLGASTGYAVVVGPHCMEQVR